MFSSFWSRSSSQEPSSTHSSLPINQSSSTSSFSSQGEISNFTKQKQIQENTELSCLIEKIMFKKHSIERPQERENLSAIKKKLEQLEEDIWEKNETIEQLQTIVNLLLKERQNCSFCSSPLQAQPIQLFKSARISSETGDDIAHEAKKPRPHQSNQTHQHEKERIPPKQPHQEQEKMVQDFRLPRQPVLKHHQLQYEQHQQPKQQPNFYQTQQRQQQHEPHKPKPSILMKHSTSGDSKVPDKIISLFKSKLNANFVENETGSYCCCLLLYRCPSAGRIDETHLSRFIRNMKPSTTGPTYIIFLHNTSSPSMSPPLLNYSTKQIISPLIHFSFYFNENEQSLYTKENNDSFRLLHSSFPSSHSPSLSRHNG